MKLKYYLRGLGIGIIVTLILSGIAGNKKQEMTNEEIKARAAELGMIESTTLSDPTAQTPEPTATAAQTQTPEPTVTTAPTQTPEPTATTAPTQTPEPTATTAPTQTPEPMETADGTQEMIAITVSRGDSSVKVSRLVQEAGLIEDAQDFDRYLCENGYDKRLSVGVHDIPADAGYEEIAKILTGR